MKKVFCTFDSAAEAYSDWIFAPTRGLALRSFENAANEDGNPVGDHPADIFLFEIGDFDPTVTPTKAFTPYEVAENLGCGLDFKHPPTGEES